LDIGSMVSIARDNMPLVEPLVACDDSSLEA
jgi:hypothetical protein